VWDILHHHCHDPEGIPDREALELACAPGSRRHAEDPLLLPAHERGGAQEEGRPRVERSLVLPQLRAHADLIDPIGFEEFVTRTSAGLEVDVMLEAKAKDLALLRLREQLAARGLHPERRGQPLEEAA
jgi:UV DNA damage endonuclease